MKTHRSFRHVIKQISGLAGGAHRAPSTRSARTRATQGLLVLALVLGGLGATALASFGHGSAGPARASTQQAVSTGTGSASAGSASRPWMY